MNTISALALFLVLFFAVALQVNAQSASPSSPPSTSLSQTMASMSTSLSGTVPPTLSTSTSLSETISQTVSTSLSSSFSNSLSNSITLSISMSISISLTGSVSMTTTDSVSGTMSGTQTASTTESESQTPTAPVTMTPSISATDSVSGTLSGSLTAAATSPVSTVSISMSVTLVIFPSNTPSSMATMTISPTSAVKPLLAVTNVRNLCPAEKTIACIAWDVPAGFRYNTFSLQYKGPNTAFVTINNIKNPHYTIVNLQAGSTYQVRVTAKASNGQNAPASVLQSVTTSPDKFNGIRNVSCRKQSTSIICRWTNGQNKYKNIKLLITCPANTGKRTKQIIPAGKNTFTATKVPATGSCKVQFIPNYVNDKSGPKTIFNL